MCQLDRGHLPTITFTDNVYEFDQRFLCVKVVFDREDNSPQFMKEYVIFSEGVVAQLQHDLDTEINVYTKYLGDKYDWIK